MDGVRGTGPAPGIAAAIGVGEDDMDGDQIAQLAYLGLLGAAIAGWYLVQNRDSLGRTMQYAAIWGFIFLGAVAAVGLWSDVQRTSVVRQAVSTDGRIELPRGPDGHYRLTLEVNGAPVEFVVDTGASMIVLNQSDAERVGIDTAGLAYLGMAQTANGAVRTAAVTLGSVELAGQTDFGVPAVVNEGAIDVSLLGMSYLGEFTHIEIAGDRMVLTR